MSGDFPLRRLVDQGLLSGARYETEQGPVWVGVAMPDGSIRLRQGGHTCVNKTPVTMALRTAGTEPPVFVLFISVCRNIGHMENTQWEWLPDWVNFQTMPERWWEHASWPKSERGEGHAGSSTVGTNEFQHPEEFKCWNKCSLYGTSHPLSFFSPRKWGLGSIPPRGSPPRCPAGTALSHGTAGRVASSNVFDEESLPSVSIKGECGFWRLWEYRGTELFQTKNCYWRLCVGLEVKHEFVFYKKASPALTCQILMSGSYISHFRLVISHILLK